MAVLKLRHIPRSRSMRILWLLEEVSCDYELEVIKQDLSLSDVLSPVARVPALCDGDAMMHETGAMTDWICETRALHLWRSPGAEGRAGWLDWLHFGETLAVYAAVVHRLSIEQTPPPAHFDEMKRLQHALGVLDGWLDASDWLLRSFSGADCHVGYSVWIASQVTGLADHPRLKSYLTQCCARDAFQRAELLSDQ